MPDPITALVAGGSQLIGGMMQSDAASEAAAVQSGAAEAGIAAQERMSQAAIEEQRRQFDRIREILSPYVQEGQRAITGFQPFREAGATAFEQQQALSGLRGPAAQQAAIAQLEQSPEMAALTEQGERALLQRASATGGLRGGNVQAALAEFRPQVLSALIERQLGRLGGFAGTGLGVEEQLYRGGQAAAGGQASAAGTMGANVGNLLTGQGTATANLLAQQGAAQAGGALGQARGFGQALSAIPQGLGAYYGATGRSPFGAPSTAPIFGTVNPATGEYFGSLGF